MPSVQPVVSEQQILQLLRRHFSGAVSDVAIVTGGEVARTVGFSAEGQAFILRLVTNQMGATYKKEAQIWQRLAPRVPIPRVLHIGSVEDWNYAISERVPGKPLVQHTWEENEQLVPQLIEVIHAIHETNISDTHGYGLFDDQEVGMCANWQEHLLRIKEEEPEWEFFGKWHALFETTFLERDVFTFVFQDMVKLLDYCPRERYLVHGGPSFGNVIAHEGQITGVIDWLDARYGDFVYDVAGSDIWAPRLRMADRFQQFCEERGIALPHYEQRLRCYRCYMCLDGMRYYAKVGNVEGYRWVKKAILDWLRT